MNGNHARKLNRSPHVARPTEKRQVKVKIHKTGWITKGEKMLYSLLGTITIIAGAYVISFSSTTDQLNRELQSLETTIVSQVEVNDSLAFEINELSDPARITKIARDNGLKVQYAEVKRVQSLNDN